jgi:hypothetical protein
MGPVPLVVNTPLVPHAVAADATGAGTRSGMAAAISAEAATPNLAVQP